MRPIVIDEVAWSVCQSVIGHDREPRKSGSTDRDVVRKDSGGPKELCIRWGTDPPCEEVGLILTRKRLLIVKYIDSLP